MKYTWNKEEIEKAVKNNTCYNDVLKELNIPLAGNNTATLKRKIAEYNISIAHFTFRSKFYKPFNEKDVKEYLKEGTSIKSAKLKIKLLKAGLKENKCECCGISTWQNKPITIQLHHINGNPKDNRLENLQMLCPNCHSQTENYCGLANSHQHYCKKCGRKLKTDAEYCLSCAKKEENYQKWYNRLKDNPKSNTELGHEYGVTEACIRKWRKKLKLTP